MFIPKIEFETEAAGHDYVDALTKEWPQHFKAKIPRRMDRVAADRLRVVRIFVGAVEAEAKRNAEEKQLQEARPRQEKIALGNNAPAGELEKRLRMTRETEAYDHRRIGS